MDSSVLALAAASYAAGGIPSGYWISKTLKGIDIRQHGSGNPGAANVYRVVGKGAGVATLLIDGLKGFLPVLAARRMFPDDHAVMILCGALAIVGHIWTIFLRFKGGKGVATSAGVFCALLPKAMGPTVLVFALGVGVTGHISVGSMASAASLPLFAWLFGYPPPLVALGALTAAVVLIKHIPNLKRLLNKEELLYKHGSHLENSKEKQ